MYTSPWSEQIGCLNTATALHVIWLCISSMKTECDYLCDSTQKLVQTKEKNSLEMVHPRDLAGNAEKGKEKGSDLINCLN